jgi:hypothetical protein
VIAAQLRSERQVDTLLNRPPAPAGNEPVNQQHDDSADDCTDQTGTFAGAVPTERLPEIGRNERSHDPQNGRQDETRRLVVAGHDELGDYAGDKTNDDGPENAQFD